MTGVHAIRSYTDLKGYKKGRHDQGQVWMGTRWRLSGSLGLVTIDFGHLVSDEEAKYCGHEVEFGCREDDRRRDEV